MGFDVDAQANALAEYINTGRRPTDKHARMFLGD
jgi:hypothetical protein